MNKQCKCGGKLYASDNLLLSMPAQREYLCDKCGEIYYERLDPLIIMQDIFNMGDDIEIKKIESNEGEHPFTYSPDSKEITIPAPDSQRENIIAHQSDGSLTIKINRSVKAI